MPSIPNPNPNSLLPFTIQPIPETEYDSISKMCVNLFSEAVNCTYLEGFFYFMADFTISRKAVLNGKTIGCYLLNEESITSYEFNSLENLDSYRDKKGLQGVALGILKEYRGHSYGRQLRDSALSLTGYDYIWGFNAGILNNLPNWQQYGRRLVGENESSYVTLMDLSMKARMSA
jgi:hypothetical protein